MNYFGAIQPSSRLVESLRDRYVFLSMLGRGGSSMVYEVGNLQVKRVEALKVLTYTLGAETTRRFIQEARISALLEHPGIVKVYDFGQVEDSNWYSMELIEGPSLSAIIEDGIQLDATDMARLGIPLLDALAYSHGRGVIHRDIKPANIMLHMNGNPCLTDFGIAKSLDSTDHTQTGSMIGTPAYMSPEQAEGKRVDGRADQYSLAITLYRAVTGRLPFSSVGPLETLVQRLKEDPEPIDWHCPDFPAPLRDVLMKAMSKDKGDRFMTIEDMRSAMVSACDVCRIQWKRPFKGFEHLVVARKPKMHEAGHYYETGMTATARRAATPKPKPTRPLLLIGSVAASVAVTALASFLFFKRYAVESRVQTPDEVSLNQGSVPGGIPSSVSPKAENPTVPAAISDTKATNVSPSPAVPAPAMPPIPVAPPVVRRPVSPPLMLESNTPSSIVIPPELAGKQVRAILKVGENGKVIEFRALDRNLTPVEIRIATAIAMNMVFSPALAEDGEPVVSETTVAIVF